MNNLAAEATYLFRHALLRDAAYDLQLPAERAQLHETAADVLEAAIRGTPSGSDADDQCAEIARHLQVARGFRDTPQMLHREQRLVLRAAEYSARTFDNAQSARLWLRRAQICSGDDALAALYSAATAFARIGDFERASGLFLRTADEASKIGDTSLHGLALSNLATTLWIVGQRDKAEAMQRSAIEILDSCGAAERAATARVNLANQLAMSGRHGDAMPLFETASRALAASGGIDSATVAANHATCLIDLGRCNEAMPVLEQAVDAIRSHGDSELLAALLAQQARCLSERGELEPANQLATSAATMCRRFGNPATESMVLGILGRIRVQAGLTDGIDEIYEHALTLARECGSPYDEGLSLCEFALAMIVTGRETRARPLWQRGITILRTLGDQPMIDQLTLEAARLCAGRNIEPI